MMIHFNQIIKSIDLKISLLFIKMNRKLGTKIRLFPLTDRI
jgi:hypothetical protein